MQNAVELKTWPTVRAAPNARVFGAIVRAVHCRLRAAFASWLPLQVSIVTLFLFAGPHNWFELRYFLMRLPVRFGRSRNFFLTAFAGLGVLTLTYVSLPFLYNATLWSEEAWYLVIASWNTAAAVLAGVAGLAAEQAKATRELDVDDSRRTRALFVELAWSRPVQSRDRLRSSADRALVSRSAYSSHATGVVASLPALSLAVASRAGCDDLAVVADCAAGGR